MLKSQVEMMGRSIRVDISKRAKSQLNHQTAPLFIEMELYFSCLLRKQLRVYEGTMDERETADEAFIAQLSDDIQISFRPVMTSACSVESCEGEKPPLSDFPIQRPQSYVPKWVKLDFKQGKWCGDFGY